MSKVVIEITTLPDGKLNVSNKFQKDAIVLDILTALSQTHEILLHKLNTYSKSEKKRQTATIDQIYQSKKP